MSRVLWESYWDNSIWCKYILYQASGSSVAPSGANTPDHQVKMYRNKNRDMYPVSWLSSCSEVWCSSFFKYGKTLDDASSCATAPLRSLWYNLQSAVALSFISLRFGCFRRTSQAEFKEVRTKNYFKLRELCGCECLFRVCLMCCWSVVDATNSARLVTHTHYEDLILCCIMLYRVYSDDLYFNKWFIMF